MAVKIRLRRMGQKKAPYYAQPTEVVSRIFKSVGITK